MASIQEFLAQSKSYAHKESIPPAVYTSKVKKVKIDNRYKDTAVVIIYELTGEDGEYRFEECFVKNSRYPRTRKFYKYLSKIGVTSEEDFVGCCEELDLRWDFTNTGKRELTIVERTFLGFDAEAVESCDMDEGKSTADA